MFATAKMSDGVYFALTQAELNVTSSVLSTSKRITLTVPVVRPRCKGTISWKLRGGREVARNDPYVSLNLPAVTSITATLMMTHNVIFFERDPLATTPVSAPTSTRIKAIVHFTNDVKKDFSEDERVTFSIDRADLAVVENKRDIRTPHTALTFQV